MKNKNHSEFRAVQEKKLENRNEIKNEEQVRDKTRAYNEVFYAKTNAKNFRTGKSFWGTHTLTLTVFSPVMPQPVRGRRSKGFLLSLTLACAVTFKSC